MTKKIPLTQGQEAIVDDGYWFNYLMQWIWHAQWSEKTQSFYAVRDIWLGGGKKKTIRMHRVVANTPDGMWCDHRNHNTLQNTEDNLRNVTPAQSQMNKKPQKNNVTGVTGVDIRAKSGKYRAQLRFEGKHVLNKNFNTLEEAVYARKEAEKKYFGEFTYKESK